MVKLSFIGDIFPADEFFTCGFGIKSKTTEENIRRWTKNVSEIVDEADYIIGNLESPLLDDTDANGKVFYGRPEFADVLKGSGINIVNIANNHITEHGAEGYYKTLTTLRNKGIQIIGQAENGLSNILSICHDGTTICMAAFCDERICSIDNYGCYANLTEERVMATLGRMKGMHPDIIIFIFHWGNEYIHIPSPDQRELSKKLIDAGANLIIGHHPHVIQPYECYHGGYIVYSLGNFCFDDVQSDHFGKGMVANFTIQGSVVSNVSFSGILVQDMAFNDNIVKPMNTKDFERYFSQIANTYKQLQQLPEDAYSEVYKKTLKREHKRERIDMRLNLVKKMLALRHLHRIQLIKNIKNFIIK